MHLPNQRGASPGESSHPGHLDEDVIEQYCFGRLEEEAAATVEEHLLLCESCQARVTQLDQFLLALRAAAATRDRREPERARPSWYSWPALAGAAALVMLVVVIAPLASRHGPAQRVELNAFRGMDQLSSVAQAGRPLDLRVDLTGVSAAEVKTIAVVNERGAPIVRSSVEILDGRARLFHQPGLPEGQYWVRLEDAAGEILRETGLRISH